MNVWDMHHKCACVFKMEDVAKLTLEGMNELKYEFVPSGIQFEISVWLMLIPWLEYPCKTG